MVSAVTASNGSSRRYFDVYLLGLSQATFVRFEKRPEPKTPSSRHTWACPRRPPCCPYRSLCVKKNHLILSPRGLPRRDNHSTFLFFWVPTKLPQITAVICTSNNTQSPLMDGKPIWKRWSATISCVKIHCAFHEVEINALHIISLVRYI